MTTRAVMGAASLAAALLLTACTSGDAPAGTAERTPGGEASGSSRPDTAEGDGSADDALVLSECGEVTARRTPDVRIEYLGVPVVQRVPRGGEVDRARTVPAPGTPVGATVTAPARGADVDVSRDLERRIARAARVSLDEPLREERIDEETFSNSGPARDFLFLDYVTYRVVRWSATDCLAFPGATVRGTLVQGLAPGGGNLSCVPSERRPGDRLNVLLRELCP